MQVWPDSIRVMESTTNHYLHRTRRRHFFFDMDASHVIIITFVWMICCIQKASAVNSTGANSSESSNYIVDLSFSTSPDDPRRSDEFSTCTHVLLSSEEYVTYPNGSVYVPHYDKLYDVADYLKDKEDDIFICLSGFDPPDDGTTFRKSSPLRVVRETTNSSETPSVNTDPGTVGSENHTFPEDGITDLETVTANLSFTPSGDPGYHEDFLNCWHWILDKGDFVRYPNGSIHTYGKLFNVSWYANYTEDKIAVCSEFFERDKYHDYLGIVTLVGTAISTVCLVLHIITFLVFKKMRNLPGYSLFFLSIALLVAYMCVYITASIDYMADCTAVGVIKMYAFLSSFFWMNAMSYDVWRSLRMATNKLRLTGNSAMIRRLAEYSAYAWGGPLCFVVIGLIVNASGAAQKEYQMLFARDTCWFLYKQALLVYFTMPIFVLIGVNVVLFVWSFRMINSASMNTAENKADLWSRFMVCLRLAVVMGLIWIFGLLATVSKALSWLAYFSNFCTVLQGMFIFFSFTFTDKMRKELRKAVQRRKTSSFPTQSTSTHQSTSV